MDMEDGPISDWRFWLSVAYIAFLFAFPPKLLSATGYSALVIGISLVYFLANSAAVLRRGFFASYLLFAGLALLVILGSRLELFEFVGRDFDPGRIFNHAGGMLVLIALIPNLAHASGVVFRPQLPLIPLAAICGLAIISVLLFQPDENVFLNFGLYGVQSPGMLLQFSYFLLVLKARDPRIRALLLLLPLPLLSAASNVAIQLALAGFVLSPRWRGFPIFLTGLLATLIMLIAWPPAWLEPFIAADINSNVRSHLWHEALPELATNPLGIGYGTSWQSQEALRDPVIWRLFANEEFRSQVLPNHSSLIDVPLRLGWLGLVLFAAMVVQGWKAAWRSDLAIQAGGAMTMAMVACTFNPAVESARSAIFIAFAIAYLRAASLRPVQLVEPEPDPETKHTPAMLDMSPADRRRLMAQQGTAPAP
jgi:hypothetical protein